METIGKVAIFRIDEQNYLAFQFVTYTMLKVEEKNINAFKLLLDKNNPVKDIANICNYDITYIKELQEQIPQDFFSDELFEDTHQNEIAQLTFLGSTNCNLRCKYCFADEGNYDYPAENMSIETANQTIDFFLEKYSAIRSILFFGGEALLNFKLIKSVVEKFENMHLLGKISDFPRYVLISNGTLLNDEIMEFLSKHNFNVTISLDGSKIINDQLRVFQNNKGTFDIITRNINKLKNKYPNVNLGWECTYTSSHEKMGLKIEDVRKSIREITGIEDGLILPAMKTKNTNLQPNQNIYEKYSKNTQHADWQNVYEGKRIDDFEFLETIMRFVDKSYTRYMCAMGFFAFTITPSGDIFPCHMLASGEKTDFLIGNINDNKDLLSSNIERMSDKLKIYDKAKNENCNKCYALGFCNFCPSVRILENNFQVAEQLQDTCDKIKSQVKDLLVKMAAIRIDEKKWNNLLHSIEISFVKETSAC